MTSLSVRLALVALLLLALAGAAVRLAPLMSEARTMASVTEDGYLMLTVARNLALGRGMTTAAGTELTNGVQPAVTMAWAAVHGLTGGARLPALRAIVIVNAVVAALTAWCVWRLARGSFRRHPWRDRLAASAAVAWWASPIVVRHTTNGLETGAYALGLAIFLLLDRDWASRRPGRAVVMGVLLGVLFLLRNDAVFLVAIWGLLELAGIDAGGARPLVARVRHVATAAVVVAAAASPWLYWNASRFGHLVPTSGRAESLESALGEGVRALPRVAAECLLVAVPLPVTLDRLWAIVLVVALAVVAAVACTWRLWAGLGLVWDRPTILAIAFSCALAVYYAVFFGASHFLSRYVFPVMLVTPTIVVAWTALAAMRWRTTGVVVAGGLMLAAVAGDWRIYDRGDEHPHRPVVDWVAAHVADDVWVGAPQSGTLGYFHDRTVNLDGKVNPHALAARREQRLFRYIVDETPIEYVADWMGIERWLNPSDVTGEDTDASLMRSRFVVAVRDPARNLVVLRRRR